jgi:PLP dependent protein
LPQAALRIADNLAAVRQRIAEAAARSGRRADDITLVAVTKYVGVEEIRALVEAGCHDLGEARPQQLWDRAEALAGLPVRWHLIGHLQRNKVRRTVPLVAMIHSVDSLRLAAAIDEALACGAGVPSADGGGGVHGAANKGIEGSDPAVRLPVLLEVNISGEPAKHGFAAADIGQVLQQLAGFHRLKVRGLMCMAGLEGDLSDARRQFAATRDLRDLLRQVCPAEVTLDELSMGMSGDYEAAIEEGATMVRVGSALFEGVMP